MIIFDEFAYAESLLDENNTTLGVKQRDLNIIARYYKFNGLTKDKIYEKIVDYYEKKEPHFNEVLYERNLEYAIRSAMRTELRTGVQLRISQAEMEQIWTIPDMRIQRVLFMMLVIAKFYNKGTGDFFYNGRLGDVFRKAKQGHIRVADRNGLIHWLNQNGFIEANLMGGYRIPFAEHITEDKDAHVIIEDVDNPMEYFSILCADCGEPTFGTPTKHRICEKCKSERRKADVRQNVASHRAKAKM